MTRGKANMNVNRNAMQSTMQSTKQSTKQKTITMALAVLLTLSMLMSLTACANTAANTDSSQATGQSQNQSDSSKTDTSNIGVPTEPITFTDDLGNEITVENPQRVVACMGSFANAWQLAGGSLIGASDDAFSDYGVSSTSTKKVGDFSALSLEAIIDLEPDFVILTGASTGKGGTASQKELRESLVASDIAAACFTVTTFADYQRVFGIFCEITGRSDLYKTNCEDIAVKINNIVAKVTKSDAPTVLIMTTYSGGTRVQDSSTLTGDIFASLGAVNLAEQNPSLLRDFSLEAIIDMNPDFIFVVPMGNDAASALRGLEDATAANPAWATLEAVQNGKYITLDPEHFQYKPNNKWDESYQIIYNYLYS
ncbi:MAG: ABC transporter substrate-binding protein [Coriobacteriales bacterium]|jgi:iron complex transport system substrate-binding protein|nr:ABC transporter substrate-binding protein [Coriobacteriales bacterium]